MDISIPVFGLNIFYSYKFNIIIQTNTKVDNLCKWDSEERQRTYFNLYPNVKLSKLTITIAIRDMTNL